MATIINGVKCRTREESLRHIIKQAKAGKIGPNNESDASSASNCMYEYRSGNNCAVGCLLSKEQLKDLKRQSLNEMSIFYVAATNSIGLKNVETVTGMKLPELRKIQMIHDQALERSGGVQMARNKLIEYCEKELEAI
jgi:hypothetical protein